jgi:hypothetical protein
MIGIRHLQWLPEPGGCAERVSLASEPGSDCLTLSLPAGDILHGEPFGVGGKKVCVVWDRIMST